MSKPRFGIRLTNPRFGYLVMEYDKDKVDDMVLALLWLTTFEQKQFAPGK